MDENGIDFKVIKQIKEVRRARIKEYIDEGRLGEVYHVYASFRAHRSIPGLGGAFTTKEIAEALKAQYGVDLPKTRLERGEPIKSFGTYRVKAKLYTEVVGEVIVQVEEA